MRAGIPGIRAAPFIGLTAVEGRSLSRVSFARHTGARQ